MPQGKQPRWLQAARVQDRSRPRGELDWLSRALSRAGVLCAIDAEQAILAGRVRVNGRVQVQPLAAYRAGDRVTLDGREVSLVARTQVLMLHKPAGVVSAATDPEKVGTVFEVLARAIPTELHTYAWHGVGRLDRGTTGLLLFTNDERVVAYATSPASHLPKRYVAQVGGAPTDARLKPLRDGMLLDDGPTRPALARLRGDGRVELTLSEGRHHQVKRMLAAVGLPVLGLHREAIGQLELDVAVGEFRALSEEEVRVKLRFDAAAPPVGQGTQRSP